ncbi:MAG: TIGR02444 family protein [Pseudomonadota bacterium]
MSTAEGEGWPDEPFWDFSLALYRKPGVEAACLDLQKRHGVDVNLVLFCLWLGTRGTVLDEATTARLGEITEEWQTEVVVLLRGVRSHLKSGLPSQGSGMAGVADAWPEQAGAIRRQTLALELDAEHLEQLFLGSAAATLSSEASAGPALASDNLRHYWDFDERDRDALKTLLGQCFPGADLRSCLDWLDRP